MLAQDSCTFNRSISKRYTTITLCNPPEVAVKNMLAGEEPTFFQMQQVMGKLWTSLFNAKLRRWAHFKLKPNNGTGWNYIYIILLRQVQFRAYVFSLNEIEIDALLLRPTAKRKVNVSIRKLKNLDEVSIRLQRQNASVHCARDYFDTILENYPSLSDQLDFGA